jgi:hypothetical protein
MEKWKMLADTLYQTTKVLDRYLEYRTDLKETGIKKNEFYNEVQDTLSLFLKKTSVEREQNALHSVLYSYGFDDISKRDISLYLKPKFDKIDSLIPLDDGDNERDDTGN